jgi:hypothetical protein
MNPAISEWFLRNDMFMELAHVHWRHNSLFLFNRIAYARLTFPGKANLSRKPDPISTTKYCITMLFLLTTCHCTEQLHDKPVTHCSSHVTAHGSSMHTKRHCHQTSLPSDVFQLTVTCAAKHADMSLHMAASCTPHVTAIRRCTNM